MAQGVVGCVAGSLWGLTGWLPASARLGGYALSCVALLGLLSLAAQAFAACFDAAAQGQPQVSELPELSIASWPDTHLPRGLQLLGFGWLTMMPALAAALWLGAGSWSTDVVAGSPLALGLGLAAASYWPMALATSTTRGGLAGLFDIAAGARAIARAPGAYLGVVMAGTAALCVGGAAFAMLSNMTGQLWVGLLGSGFALGSSAGVQGALMGALARRRPDTLSMGHAHS